SVSAACCSGESPASSAAARPPCAQKLALSASGFLETRQTRPPSSAARSATQSPAAPAPTTATSKLSLSLRELGKPGGVRYPAMGLYLRHPLSFEHDTGPHPENAERVRAIERELDSAGWHGHHGNGTQEVFYDSDRVLFCSIHQSPLYPGSGDEREQGAGAGEGFTVNLPVAPGAGSDEFLALVQSVIVPMAREYRPAL